MSRYFNSFMDDSSEELEHSWGTSPKAKAREKEYNHWYYQKHKAEIEAVRKQRHAATNSYKQAEKTYKDAIRYQELSDQMDARLHGWKIGPRTKTFDGYSRNVTPIYEWGGLDQDGTGSSLLGLPTIVSGDDNGRDVSNGGSKARHLTNSAKSRLENTKKTYKDMSDRSALRSDKLTAQADKQNALAKAEAKRVLQGLKNPTAKDLVEFYFDTTVVKAKKSANKAKKYATKAMSTAEKAAKKYATKAKKADKYATKIVKSVANKAKKSVVR